MLMALLSVSQCLAWTTVPLASIRQQQRLRMPKSVLQMSDQWDDEPELPAAPTEPVPEKIASGPWKVEGTFEPDELEELFRKNDLTTYDEANSAMVDEKEQKELEAMGGADNYIPGVSTCVYERALTWSQLTTNRWGQHGTNSTHTYGHIENGPIHTAAASFPHPTTMPSHSFNSPFSFFSSFVPIHSPNRTTKTSYETSSRHEQSHWALRNLKFPRMPLLPPQLVLPTGPDQVRWETWWTCPK